MGYCVLHYQDHQHDLIDHVEEMRREEEARGCPPRGGSSNASEHTPEE